MKNKKCCFEHEIGFYDNVFVIRGPTGATGPRGLQGEKGITGAEGKLENLNATVFNKNQASISNGTKVEINEVENNNGLLFEDSEFTIIKEGTYFLIYTVNSSQDAIEGESIGIAINGEVQQSTKRPLLSVGNSTGFTIANLAYNDTITLVPTVAQNRIVGNLGAPSFTFSIIKLA